MLIEYIHFLEPDTVKIYDTVKSFRNNRIEMAQDEWDEHELKRMEEDKNKGHIISYRIFGGSGKFNSSELSVKDIHDINIKVRIIDMLVREEGYSLEEACEHQLWTLEYYNECVEYLKNSTAR